MKVREGFVSNSSSSSFIIAVRKTTHDAVIEKMDLREREVVEKTVIFESAFGIELAVRGEFFEASGYTSYTGNLNEYEYEENGKNEIVLKDEDGEEYTENLISHSLETYDMLCKEIEKDSFYGSVDDGG